MNLDDILQRVEPKWRLAFQRFIHTGVAEPDFLEHLNRDSATQAAVEMAFRRQAKGFEGLSEELKRSRANANGGRDSKVSCKPVNRQDSVH